MCAHVEVGGWLTVFWFSPSTPKWLPGIKLKLPGLCGKPELSHRTLTNATGAPYMTTTASPDMPAQESLTPHLPETSMG